MWNTPSREQLDLIPRLYETENIPTEEKLIYLHFFIGGCDWFIAEYDGDDLFFGFAILNSDYEMAEWGYISFAELQSISVRGIEIDCELNWTFYVFFNLTDGKNSVCFFPPHPHPSEIHCLVNKQIS